MEEEINFRTEREILREIIELYKDLPCLWDTSSKYYKKQHARSQAIDLIVEKWKFIQRDATSDFVKKKLENMRTTFIREWRKVKASESRAVNSEDVHKPLLWYYKDMLFLVNGVTSREDHDSDESEHTSMRKKRKRPSLETRKLNKFKVDTATSSPSSQSEAIELTALAMAHQLKEMSRKQQCIAAKLMSDVIFYGKLDQLTEYSSISLNASSHHIHTGSDNSEYEMKTGY